MRWQELLVAIGLLMVFEGIMPFLNPPAFRKALWAMTNLDDLTLRIIGALSMASGLGVLYWIN